MKKFNFWLFTVFSFLSFLPQALAENTSFARPLQLGLPEAASPQMERIVAFHDGILLYTITAIVILVSLLLLWVMFRYNAKTNPTPSKTTHHVMLEVLWTVVPIVILIVILIPSFKMLYYLDRTENPEMTLKITGHQWYWEYEYPDHDALNFSSYMIPDEEIDTSKGQRRLLSTDNPVVLPIDTNITLQITAENVIHAFAMPAFGLKKDAVPGRLSEIWVRIEKTGTYFGQCSEICGINHAYMPIEIKAVTKEEFQEWLKTAKEEFADNSNHTITLAQIEGVQ